MNKTIESVYPGIWRIRFGVPEEATPVSKRNTHIREEMFEHLSSHENPPFDFSGIAFKETKRGCKIVIPYNKKEKVYGCGLQLKSLRQDGKKRTLRVNADPAVDTGDSHAPVPFYVSNAGYGVFIDTCRYVSIYIGTHMELDKLPELLHERENKVKTDVDSLYSSPALGSRVVVDAPVAHGVDIYVFAGPSMLDAVKRYVIFSGGGFIPPLWGLAPWYRCHADFSQNKVIAFAEKMREEKLPFSVMGLEPGWQSAFYPNSFVWSERFPEPENFISALDKLGFRINLWENAFVDPVRAPFADTIKPHCADEAATSGLTPDFIDSEGKRIFADYHKEQFVNKGISGFKLDECDNGDFFPHGAWSFPEYCDFPSGIDGEQMHSFYGVKYQETIDSIYRSVGKRHYSLVRSSHALAANLPFVLYSDLYKHEDFVRGLVGEGFSGLLWTPEVRDSISSEDLIRRIQSVVLSPCALINAWYLENFPWTHRGRKPEYPREDAAQLTSLVRQLMELRMRLLPYLYTAFARYHFDGTPPFRALVMDYPHDENTYNIDDEWLIGESLLAAPFISGRQGDRDVYLPEGIWYGFENGNRYEGAKKHVIENKLETLPLFVKEGTVLPLAEVVQAVRDGEKIKVCPQVFGSDKAEGELYDDDASSYAYETNPDEFSRIKISWSQEKNFTVYGMPASIKLWELDI